ITMDDFLKLPDWNETVMSKEKSPMQRSVEKPDAKIATAREKKDKQTLTKAQAKRAGEASSSAPKPLNEATGSQKKDAKKTVIDLSEHTRDPTPKPSPFNLEEDLDPKSQQLSNVENQSQLLEKEKEELTAQLARSEADGQSIVRDFIPTVVGKLQTSKVANSYLLPSGDLMNVFPDVPIDTAANKVGASTQDGDASSSQPKPQDTAPPNVVAQA
ncbi:hypothetical protein Tco_0986274, partial [Tanacetum coccineum]